MASFPELRPNRPISMGGSSLVRRALLLGLVPVLALAAVLAVLVVPKLAGPASHEGVSSAPASSTKATGLPQAAAYGASKAGLSHFAETLHLELAPRGISVYLINPGFVATPMTATNAFPMPALITPAEAADEIIAGLSRSGFEIHFPRRFTFWLKLLRLLPYRIYFPLARRLTGA